MLVSGKTLGATSQTAEKLIETKLWNLSPESWRPRPHATPVCSERIACDMENWKLCYESDLTEHMLGVTILAVELWKDLLRKFCRKSIWEQWGRPTVWNDLLKCCRNAFLERPVCRRRVILAVRMPSLTAEWRTKVSYIQENWENREKTSVISPGHGKWPTLARISKS